MSSSKTIKAITGLILLNARPLLIGALILLGVIIISPLLTNAQTSGPAFIFSDTSIQKSDLDILQSTNESTSYIYTINSSDGRIMYDPTSDYTVAFHPTIFNTYGASAGGIIAFIANNPELAGLLLAVIILMVITYALLTLLAFIILRRK